MQSATNSLIILDCVDSTNNYAMAQVRDGIAEHGNAYFTYYQTSGKGRHGRIWKGEEGKNILLSIVISPNTVTVYQQFQLSVAVALASSDLFKKYAGDETKIKWPNDIFWNDRKAGGILIENVIKGNEWQWSIIGIGININQTDFGEGNIYLPVSLKQITGKDFNVVELANELYGAVMNRYNELEKGLFEELLKQYNEKLFSRDKKVKLKKGNAVFETTIKEVSREGKLITSDVMEREFELDEVQWEL